MANLPTGVECQQCYSTCECAGVCMEAGWGARVAGAIALAIGAFWLVAWLGGVAAHWAAAGVLIVKCNMAVALVVAGAGLVVLGRPKVSARWRWAGVTAALFVTLLGAGALSELAFGHSLGIDNVLAKEPLGTAGTSDPLRMGVPGATSLLLVGLGLAGLAWRRTWAAYMGVAACVLNLVSLVGFLYEIEALYGRARLLGMAWPAVVALLCLGTGLVLAMSEKGPMRRLRRRDAGGQLLRQWIPVLVLVPLFLGMLRVQAQHWGLYDEAKGTGLLILALVVVLLALLWYSAGQLSKTASARAAAEAEARNVALFPIENPSPVLRVAQDGTLLFANRAAAGLLETWQFAVEGRVPEWMGSAAKRVLTTGIDEELEIEIGNRVLSMAMVPVGEREYVNFYGRDITNRKRAEEAREAALRALEQERNLLQEVMNGAKTSHLVYLDPEFNFVRVNETYARSCGYRPEEMAGKNHFALYPNAENEAIFARVRDTGEAVTLHDKPFVFPDQPGRGVTYWDWTLSPVKDAANQVVGLIFSLFETTERKRVEEVLQRSEAWLTQAVRVAGLGIFEHDHRSERVEYSPLLRDMLGFGPNEPLSVASTLERVLPEDRNVMASAIARAHDPAGDGLFVIEYRVPKPGGRVQWLHARSRTFFEGQGSRRRAVRTVGAVLDVTERKEFQAELERLVAERTAKLQELVGELEHFSYTITHDMRAPLRAMMGFGELVSELCSGCIHEERKEFIRRIMTSSKRMDALIRDALNYSQSVRQELPLEDVDSGALLRGMLDSYPELQSSKARVRIEGSLPVVLGNEAGLTQCFSNLLSNAVKFVKPGEVPDIRIWGQDRNGRVRIWVEDKGVGIPKEMLPRVFDMFSRGHKGYEGTGIGLALVRKVAHRMGGTAGVESEENKGSRFWVELRCSGRLEGAKRDK